MNKKIIAKNALKFTGKTLKVCAVFFLSVIESVLNNTEKKNEHDPSFHEKIHGEKLPITGKYYIPDEKSRER